MLIVELAIFAGAGYLFFDFIETSAHAPEGSAAMFPFWVAIGLFVLFGILANGFFVLEPGNSKVATFFGKYVGTKKDPGFYFVNPFTKRTSLSIRARTLNGEKLKVNDSSGNPIEIGAIVVWKVVDTYSAKFSVDDYVSFVGLQSETALRHVAGSYPYDSDKGETSLMHNSEEVITNLKRELTKRLELAGVEIIEARLSHLAYSQEIAGIMLRKQQAAAVIAARQRIVDGAVGMVELALNKLEDGALVNLDDERKASMVSNLMLVLCSESNVQPVVNAGTLY